MKLALVLLLCAASVALLRAEETEEADPAVDVPEDTELDFLHDGSIEDEVLGHDEDPKRMLKKMRLKKLGGRRVCGGLFKRCVMTSRGPCRIVAKVCKVKYHMCRCAVKGLQKCRQILMRKAMKHRRMRKHGKGDKKHDEDEEEEVEDEDRKKNFGLFHRKRGKFMKCIELTKGCVKLRVLACSKHKPHGREGDEVMADMAEAEEEADMAEAEEGADMAGAEDEAEGDEDKKHGIRRLLLRKKMAFMKCKRRAAHCIIHARGDCKRQFGCFRGLKRCVRMMKIRRKMRKMGRPRPTPRR